MNMKKEKIISRKKNGSILVVDRRIVVSEFELQSHYYVHFRANTIGGEGMNPLILQAVG